MGLRHFLAPLGAEKLSGQGKEVYDLKTPETLVNTSPSLSITTLSGERIAAPWL